MLGATFLLVARRWGAGRAAFDRLTAVRRALWVLPLLEPREILLMPVVEEATLCPKEAIDAGAVDHAEEQAEARAYVGTD